MTNIDTLNSILLQYRAELKHGLNEIAGHDPIDQALQALNLYIEDRERLARLDELKHIDNPANVRLWFDGYYGVKERIEELEK
jgi:hypothetical protein